ncbi:MAG TPA: GxxExxY protein [Candidatus Binatia bacterium]
MTESDVNQLCDRARQIAFDIHVYLGPGHLERVYETALVHRLRKVDMVVQPQQPLMFLSGMVEIPRLEAK